MSNILFSLRRLGQNTYDDIAGLEIRVGNTVLTRLQRQVTKEESQALLIPSAPLAFWFAENWWRLRWEPRGASPPDSWRMAHEMSAIGNGHAWPRVTIWGDRERVMLVARADPAGVVGPVRLLTNALTFTTTEEFEVAVDGLLDQATSIVSSADQTVLLPLIELLREERSNPQSASWRRIEAISGYNPDEAPEALVEELLDLESTYQADDVEEAVAAHSGEDTATTLKATIEAATQSASFEFSAASSINPDAFEAGSRLQPWIAAEHMAGMLRSNLSQADALLGNKRLSEFAGISADYLQTQPAVNRSFPYALRLTQASSTVLLTARWGHDRRFQLARAIGDSIWTNGSSLGPISSVASSRQKYQRAFAAALLCPVLGLQEFLGTDNPTDADISEAARHFHVNEKTVRTVLVNKSLMERQRLGQPLSDPLDPSSLDEIADAA